MASILVNSQRRFIIIISKPFPKNALNVGLGCGDTSQWFSLHGMNVTTLEIDSALLR